MDRAYSLLEIKSVEADRRIFSGIASTPELDRQGEMVDPAGVTFRNPLPLLWHHDPKQPIGSVILTTTPTGILFEATLPVIQDAGALKARVDEAWQSVKAGVITGVSIGHRILEGGVERLKSGARKLVKTEICEVSLVTIPANANATILQVKALAHRETPAMKQTTAEHIQALENKRAALAARMTEIMETAADDGQTLDAAPAEEHDGLAVQVKSIDADLGRWREHEKLQITTATPVPALTTLRTASAHPVISVRPNVPLGTQFVRAACAKLIGAMESRNPAEIAQERWGDSTPEVALYLKAATAPGTTTDATWASPLVNPNIVSDFLELLRPATILGKIPGLRTVPFNCKVPSQTAGGTYGWVGESKPKPVTKLAFAAETLGINKVAGIIVLTEELVRLSNPKAEELVRDDMIAGIAQFLDAQLIDPALAAVAGVNPASITNGAATDAATANPLADFLGLMNHFVTNSIPVSGLTFIMSEANALALSFQAHHDGTPVFPDITVTGGNFKGITIVTSQAAGGLVVALQPRLILYADEGGVTIDASREASLQMDSAPDSPATATTVYVSLWQTNNVGLRAERFVTWKRIGTNSVKYLTAAAWPAPSMAGGEPQAAAVGVLSAIRSRFGAMLSTVPPGGGGWYPITVREPYTGAWQHNEAITAPTALSNPSVFAVVSRIASDISKIAPPLLLERDDNGFWAETTNPAYSPVLRRPNRYQTAQQYHERIVFSLLLHGNAYSLKSRDQRGVVDALFPLEPTRVKVLVAPDGAVYYELQPNELAGLATDTPPVIVPAREIIHLRWNCLFHDLMGISPLYAISGAITQAQTIQTSSTTFFGKGGRPAGVLIAPTKLDPLSAQRIKADAANFTTGELLVLENGMKYEPVSTTAVQQQLIEQLGWTEEKICEVFGMPISILNSAKQPPYANAEASQLQYKSECLEVHLTSIANGWTEGLDLPTYLKVEFDDTLLIWMDTTTRTNAAKVAITAGMSPNEVRDYYFGLGPVEGGETPFLQQQNWPIGDLANRQVVPPAAEPLAAPQPTDEEVAATVGDLAEP